jgi:hypothetical protein
VGVRSKVECAEKSVHHGTIVVTIECSYDLCIRPFHRHRLEDNDDVVDVRSHLHPPGLICAALRAGVSHATGNFGETKELDL